ncbi:glycerate kinase type-2 family protein [Marinovum sp.]|uniref:glycerate kinase type-2 family protein n=1 Tax=Marinovum sp. TaxID=2024839 RepID=UPI003A912654
MTPDLRQSALHLFDKAVEAADPAIALRRALAEHPLPAPGGQLHLIAIGKAAPAMLREAMAHVDGDVPALAITHYENDMEVPGAEVIRAAHPVPDAEGLRAGEEVIARLAGLGADDAVAVLVSGGGSALVPAPVEGVTLEEKAEVNRLLLGAGLDIVKMNLVRQQLSRLKGGGLLRHAAPAPVTAYILSDVIGDDLRAIASGPTVGPIGTRAEARAILEKAGVWEACPASVRAHLSADVAPPETPAAANHLIGSNRKSLEAMLAAAEGFDARIVSDALEGDVDDAAQEVLRAAAAAPKGKAQALIFGGETTVNLRGDGRGGRNQELALRVALAAKDFDLPKDWLFLSGGTDGRDGPTDAAGGIVGPGTAAAIGPEAQALLANNDSHEALRRAEALLMTGATGTNVADVQVFLIGAA